MGRTPWATEEETQWLLERLPDFRISRANDTSAQFKAATNQAYFDKFWPGIVNDGAEETTGPKGVTIQTRKSQLYWWFWNRRFGKTGVKKARDGIDLSAKKPGNVQPYQAYMSLFKDTVMPVLKTRYEDYKNSLAEDDECDVWWSFAMEEAKEMLKKETDEVKAQVEKYRHDRAHVEQGLDGFLLETNASDDAAADSDLRARARHIQSLLDALPQSLQNVLDSLEQQTGWKGTIMVGGPRPETGKFAVLCLHQGRTLNLGHRFSEASPHWPTFEAAYSEFVVSCFPQDVCQKVHEAYRGLAAPVEDTGASSSQSVATTDGTTTTAPSNPDSGSSTPTPSNSAAAADSESDPKKQKNKKKGKAKGKAKANAEPTYDELREQQIRENRAHMESLGLLKAAAALKPAKKRSKKPKKTQSSEATPDASPNSNDASDGPTSPSPSTTLPASAPPPAQSSASASTTALPGADSASPLPPSTSERQPLPSTPQVPAANASHGNSDTPSPSIVTPPGPPAVVSAATNGALQLAETTISTATSPPPDANGVTRSDKPEAPSSATAPPITATAGSSPEPSLPTAANETSPSRSGSRPPNDDAPVRHDATPDSLPDYIDDALKYFALIQGGSTWRDLVSGWVEFERALGFPESSQDRLHWLSAKDRPEEVKMWTKCARSYDRLPKIKSTEQYAVGWKRWWGSLQPPCRVADPTAWPPACIEPTEVKDWDSIRRGGPNGMFLAVISLAWWLWAVLDTGESKLDVEKAITDVAWVCKITSATMSTSRKRSVEAEDGQSEESAAKRVRRK